jgi:hypothetical protein
MTNFDLSNLVAELKVLRTPLPGRTGGEAERGGRTRTTGESQSPICEGGNAETVLSIGDECMEREALKEPIELFPSNTEGAHSGGGKRYPIFQVPTEEQGGLEGFCFKIIGRGATFCIIRNCSVNHKGGGHLWR